MPFTSAAHGFSDNHMFACVSRGGGNGFRHTAVGKKYDYNIDIVTPEQVMIISICIKIEILVLADTKLLVCFGERNRFVFREMTPQWIIPARMLVVQTDYSQSQAVSIDFPFQMLAEQNITVKFNDTGNSRIAPENNKTHNR